MKLFILENHNEKKNTTHLYNTKTKNENQSIFIVTRDSLCGFTYNNYYTNRDEI
jgi:hypothetical protein